MDLVSIEKCETYDAEKIAGIVETQFCLFEKEKPLFRKNDVVLIKPNLLMSRRPDFATTTHPSLVAAVIRAVKKRGGRPVIAESPAGPYSRILLKNIYTVSGMEEAAEKEGAELNFDTESDTIPARGKGTVNTFHLLRPVVRADAVISVAKLKTHTQMTYSGAVKNLFGTVPGLEKPEFHSRFPEPERFASMIVDLCLTVNPVLSLIDGIVGMEGNGPSGGTPRKAGLIFAGTNPFAVDAAACGKIGFSTDRVPILKEAKMRGLFSEEKDGILLTGSGKAEPSLNFLFPDSTSVDFSARLPKPLHRLFLHLVTPRPVIANSICVGCGKCAESCPRHTITITGGKAVINRAGCIKCFCCQEVCPKKAIRIRRVFH